MTRRIGGGIPIWSSAMDTVTEADMAISMARLGGIGVIHRNLPIGKQAQQVDVAKRAQSGQIVDPVVVFPDMTADEIEDYAHRYRCSGFPVVDPQTRILVGLITNRDIRDRTGNPFVRDLMVPAEKVVTSPPGTTREEAAAFFRQSKLEKLPLVDTSGRVVGLFTWKDIASATIYPNACRDDRGRLVVAAAVGTFDEDLLPRAEQLVAAGADILVIDVKNGHHQTAIDAFKVLRERFPDLSIVPGNVVTPEGAKLYCELGADAIKVGIGAGSICTSTDVTGVGMPQFTATLECAEAAMEFGVPVITDGGITSSADITKALVAGASSVMGGRIVAGTNETPELAVIDDQPGRRLYRGMGSAAAIAGRANPRYLQTKVPEGVEAVVPNRGSLSGVVEGLTMGLRTAMSELNAGQIPDLWKVPFRQYTAAGINEAHPHDVQIISQSSRELRS